MLAEEILFDALRKDPYLQVEFPLPKSQLEEAVASFLKFLALPDPLKTHIDLNISPRHRRGDIGFKHRDPQDGPYSDSKDFFHFHPLILERYSDFLKENPLIDAFMMQAKPIWEATYKIVHDLMRIMDKRFSGASEKIFATDDVHILLRFLKYNWSTSGKYLAKPHFDAGSFTLAIAESCPGLRIGRGPDDLTLIHHEENHALFMVSSNFKRVVDTDEFFPGWHDVIQQDETQIGKPFSRWAIVAFIEAANVEALDNRKRTNGTHLRAREARYILRLSNAGFPKISELSPSVSKERAGNSLNNCWSSGMLLFCRCSRIVSIQGESIV